MGCYSHDGAAQLALLIWQYASSVAGWSQILPVPSMSLVATSVEGDLVTELLDFSDISLIDHLDKIFSIGVVLVDVVLVMLLVVDFKDFSNEDRLEGVVAVLEFRQGDWSEFVLHWIIENPQLIIERSADLLGKHRGSCN